MIKLDATMQRALARAGEPHVKRPLPVPLLCADHRHVAGGCAVYITCTDRDQVLYVGSVYRPDDAVGISRRLREHLRDPMKAMRWARLWLLPIREDAPLAWVRTYEGLVGAELVPGWNERLPRL